MQNIAFYNGIYATIETVEKVMIKEFGFGDKRLKKLERAIEKELEEKNEEVGEGIVVTVASSTR